MVGGTDCPPSIHPSVQAVPDELGLMGHLKILSLKQNHLKHLPASLGANLGSLVSLDVSKNILSTLPASIERMTSLKRLVAWRMERCDWSTR